MSTDTGLRGLDLLDAAIEHIEREPETWNQGSYRCMSGMCLAGWAAVLAGGEWCPGDLNQYMVPVLQDDPEDIFGGGCHVGNRAKRLLGARMLPYGWSGDPDEDIDDDLFGSENTLDDLKRMRDYLRQQEATGAGEPS